MQKIRKCIDTYEKVNNKNYILTLEDDNKIIIQFRDENFHHLIGLGKLKDKSLVQISKRRKAKDIYIDLKEGTLDISISDSLHFSDIEDRVNLFYILEELLKGDIVIEFDNKKVPRTKLKCKNILFKISDSKYIHLCLGRKGQVYYPETFIVHHNDYYVKGQTSVKIKNIEVVSVEKSNLISKKEVAATKS